MHIKVRIIDEALKPVFEMQTEINALNLMLVAESREDLVREKGAEWTAGAIPVLSRELIAAMQAGAVDEALEKAAIQVTLAIWLFDSIYCGVTAETFMESDLVFTMMQDGTVKYERHKGISNDP